jgi:hypothetical protein
LIWIDARARVAGGKQTLIERRAFIGSAIMARSVISQTHHRFLSARSTNAIRFDVAQFVVPQSDHISHMATDSRQ